MDTAQKQIKDWCQREGRKMQWLAAQVPCSGWSMSRWVQGHAMPSEENRERLAQITKLKIVSRAAWRGGMKEGKNHE